jgi:hypothetical protein
LIEGTKEENEKKFGHPQKIKFEIFFHAHLSSHKQQQKQRNSSSALQKLFVP